MLYTNVIDWSIHSWASEWAYWIAFSFSGQFLININNVFTSINGNHRGLVFSLHTLYTPTKHSHTLSDKHIHICLQEKCNISQFSHCWVQVKKLWEGILEAARTRLNIESRAPLPHCCLFFFFAIKKKKQKFLSLSVGVWVWKLIKRQRKEMKQM